MQFSDERSSQMIRPPQLIDATGVVPLASVATIPASLPRRSSGELRAIDWAQLDALLGTPDRLASLKASRIADSVPDDTFERFTNTLRDRLGVPVVLLSIVDADRQHFKSCIGLTGDAGSVRQTPSRQSMCKVVVVGEDNLVLDDARTHADFAGHAAVAELGVVAYAGVPVRDQDGRVLGSLCAIDVQPRRWTHFEVQLLEDFAAAVRVELIIRRSASAKASNVSVS